MDVSAQRLNACTEAEAHGLLQRCCGAERWVRGMLARRPYADGAALTAAADQVWASMERDDILEAFSHHPRIGADLSALRQKFATTVQWSNQEQAGVEAASEPTLLALQAGNIAYEARFGYLFIVCATGKTAEEMQAILEARLKHDREQELAVAAREQAQIMHLRLAKLD